MKIIKNRLNSSAIGLSLLLLFTFGAMAQTYEWQSIEGFPGLERDDAIAFAIDDFVYVGSGNHGGFAQSNRFYKYDIHTKNWKEIAPFPGQSRQYARCEVLDRKAYLIGGIDGFGNPQNDIWEYNPDLNEWKERAVFPGARRWQAASFVLNDLIYYGTGRDWDLIYSDFWQYDPVLNEWKRLSDVPKMPVYETVAFSVYGDGYLGLGRDCTGVFLNDFWSYNPNKDTWNQEEDFPGDARYYAKGETYGGQVFVGTGQNETGEMLNDVWRYDPVQSKWRNKIPIDGIGKRGLASCSIPFQGLYFIGGLDASFNRLNVVDKLTVTVEEHPFNIVAYTSNEKLVITNILQETTVSIYSLEGKLVYTEYVEYGFVQLSTAGWSGGVYILVVGDDVEKISIRSK